MQVSVEIPVEPEAAAIAREVVLGALEEVPIPEDRVEDLRLLTSELVTNSVRHAGLPPGESIGVAVDVSERRIRVEVGDTRSRLRSNGPSVTARASGGLGATPRRSVVGWLGRGQE